jgi:hypothetical protein
MKSCLSTKTVNQAQFWCLPAKKPAACPQGSWQQFTKLKGNDAVALCKTSK